MHPLRSLISILLLFPVLCFSQEAVPAADAWVVPAPYDPEDSGSKFEIANDNVKTLHYVLAGAVDNLTLYLQSLDDGSAYPIYSEDSVSITDGWYTWTVNVDEELDISSGRLCRLALQCFRDDVESLVYSEGFTVNEGSDGGSSSSAVISETPSPTPLPTSPTATAETTIGSSSTGPPSPSDTSSTSTTPASSTISPSTNKPSSTTSSPQSTLSDPTTTSTSPPPSNPHKDITTRLALGLGLGIGLSFLLISIILGVRFLLVRGQKAANANLEGDSPEIAQTRLMAQASYANNLPELVSVEREGGV